LFGATDNYNTEMFERLHIDFAKAGWRASNHRDAFPQMMRWIDRQEKVSAFGQYIAEQRPASDASLNPVKSIPNFAGQPIHIAKHPHAPNCPITRIELQHGCPSFSHHIKLYLNAIVGSRIRERHIDKASLPFTKLDVYHMFKFLPTALDDGVGEANNAECQTVKAMSSIGQKAARFDAVVVLHNDDAEATGLMGKDKYNV
jgi:hypothetical protein